MDNFKQKIKEIFSYVWECIKCSFSAGLAYATASALLCMLVLKEGKAFSEQISTCIIVIVCVLAYNALFAWGFGGANYEMLVSGNMKRMSAEKFGSAYKISSHSYVKEYRIWKGFAMGAITCVATVVFAIIFGANQAQIDSVFAGNSTFADDKTLGVLYLIGIFICGWALLPFACAVNAGYIVSYYLAIPVALLPILVFGGFYIAGAYAKRAKNIRAQEAADRAAAAQAKPKKINYGGLPGTKPRKKK